MVRHPSNNQNFKRYNGSFTKFRPKFMKFVHKTIDFPNFFYVLVLTAMSMEFRRNARVLINWRRIGLFRLLIDVVVYRFLLSLIFLLCVMVRTNELLFP